jgi:hypothetical protein
MHVRADLNEVLLGLLTDDDLGIVHRQKRYSDEGSVKHLAEVESENRRK